MEEKTRILDEKIVQFKKYRSQATLYEIYNLIAEIEGGETQKRGDAGEARFDSAISSSQ